MTGTPDDAIPPDDPIFREEDAAPMPPETAPDTCPHCGAAWSLTRASRAKVGDFAVCGHCANILVIDEDGPRASTFDETVEAEQHPGVRVLQANYRKDLSGPGPNGEYPEESD